MDQSNCCVAFGSARDRRRTGDEMKMKTWKTQSKIFCKMMSWPKPRLILWWERERFRRDLSGTQAKKKMEKSKEETLVRDERVACTEPKRWPFWNGKKNEAAWKVSHLIFTYSSFSSLNKCKTFAKCENAMRSKKWATKWSIATTLWLCIVRWDDTWIRTAWAIFSDQPMMVVPPSKMTENRGLRTNWDENKNEVRR